MRPPPAAGSESGGVSGHTGQTAPPRRSRVWLVVAGCAILLCVALLVVAAAIVYLYPTTVITGTPVP
jgi:hypothetical protein